MSAVSRAAAAPRRGGGAGCVIGAIPARIGQETYRRECRECRSRNRNRNRNRSRRTTSCSAAREQRLLLHRPRMTADARELGGRSKPAKTGSDWSASSRSGDAKPAQMIRFPGGARVA